VIGREPYIGSSVWRTLGLRARSLFGARFLIGKSHALAPWRFVGALQLAADVSIVQPELNVIGVVRQL